MAPITLTEFNLSIDVDGFYQMFWEKPQWFEEFLTSKLKDLSVNVGSGHRHPNSQVRT